MFVNSAGSTKVMLTSAFLLPWICHAPAPAAVGCTVVATPLATLAKFRLLSVVTLSACPITVASMPTAPPTPCERAERGMSSPSSSNPARPGRRVMGPGRRSNHARVDSAGPAPERGRRAPSRARSAAGQDPGRERRPGDPDVDRSTHGWTRQDQLRSEVVAFRRELEAQPVTTGRQRPDRECVARLHRVVDPDRYPDFAHGLAGRV